MRGKKRPTSERARAMGIAVVDGVPAASEATGIPASTIYQWQESQEFVELRARTKDAVAAEWWGIVQMGFRRVAHLLTDTDDLQKAAVATAIIADKMLLIRGEATARSESKDITHDLDNETRQRLTDWIDSRGMDSDAGATGGVPAGAGTEVR